MARSPGTPPRPDRARSLRIVLIASARYPIRQPFPGGLEAHTWQLASHLRARGHAVEVFGGPGSDPALRVRVLDTRPALSEHARADTSMPAGHFMAEHHAYLGVMLELARDGGYDVVHNNSLHYLPVAMAANLLAPVLTTLHTPPTPWLESAIALGPAGHFAAVSAHTADQWRAGVPAATVIHNGVDLDMWTPGPGGGVPVWSGRLVPEKGPEDAIHAARRAGRGLRLAGPIPDTRYYRERVRPLLGDGVEYVGHLAHRDLAALVGSAAVAVVSPCWDEPYGLVVAEALACGTPVAGYARGALPELLDDHTGVLVDPGDVDGLAAAITRAAALDRERVRAHAERTCSLDAMVDGYERLYRELAP
ncbi:glycosyltransferase [Actinokineospora auranticolor]|uniref:Glycosyltransferase involved in cell wall biosynthesis n=1 Tax=Actinokineospora auranticolor TaxID=155976 RepID=A0A2S6GLK0_9PSEU|nr:glycosyltransferase [Actinokineospora auranticolor]PPK66112.1 glycosyltransferase involved in cell wall biosynthesis [Actinokineospora auranticolor]